MIFRKIVDFQKPDAFALGTGAKVATGSLAGAGLVSSLWYAAKRRKKDDENTVTDMSFLNPTEVKMLIPTTVLEVQAIVRASAKICIRGSAHSMGGHTLWTDATCIDTKMLKQIVIDKGNLTVTVGAGLTWRELLIALDRKKLTVECMQSYADFTIGGSISANAHGPSSDVLIGSVLSINVVDCGGELRKLSREDQPDLFTKVIGGYGLLGVIVDVTLRVRTNTFLRLKRHVKDQALTGLYAWYKQQREPGKKCMFTVRAETQGEFAFKRANAFAWEDTGETATVPLKDDDAPFEQFMNNTKKEVLSSDKGLFFAKKVLNNFGERLFWQDKDLSSMNQHRFQVCKYVTPKKSAAHTFLLFESFIPPFNVEGFLSEISVFLLPFTDDTSAPVFLLSLYVRFVDQDAEACLSYAPDERIAFVFYFKVNREQAHIYDEEVCKKLVAATVRFEGCFYLPYRVCYNLQELISAYPKIYEFLEAMNNNDPKEKFVNYFGESLKILCNPSS
jgi:hypothetical protein